MQITGQIPQQAIYPSTHDYRYLEMHVTTRLGNELIV